ncbi:hypothetical protein MKZ38_000375 [Zalerion maritima]|uniref:Uncharacterized protein n=1 Tax=Zalerion maritima TaxID=339359 RepID=A0AAD5RF69_9PEZI|nr:hypothetical protein MKZ38_000375 [Zalerion maritima]
MADERMLGAPGPEVFSLFVNGQEVTAMACDDAAQSFLQYGVTNNILMKWRPIRRAMQRPYRFGNVEFTPRRYAEVEVATTTDPAGSFSANIQLVEVGELEGLGAQLLLGTHLRDQLSSSRAAQETL